MKKLGLLQSWQRHAQPKPPLKPEPAKTLKTKSPTEIAQGSGISGERVVLATEEHPPWTLALINQRLGIPRAALLQAVESGVLPARQQGRSWLVNHADLERWMDERSRI